MPGTLEGGKVLIRADASPSIGSGHIMRCLTLADGLRARGARIAFASALIPDSLAARIEESGHILHRISPVDELLAETEKWDSAILSPGAQREDAEHALASAGEVDCVVLDHYRLDAHWHRVAGHGATRIVVDDLANRRQDCDILVDQTLGRQPTDYADLVPDGCRVLAGAHHALLRPEFLEWRPAALARRERAGPVRRILISLGSTDIGGVTAAAFAAVKAARLPVETDIVMGSGAPSLPVIEALAAEDPTVRLHVDSRDMARLITEADLAIGAAGTSSWERCCLGIPTISLVLADNQRLVAERLEAAGAIALARTPEEITPLLHRLAGDEHVRLSLFAAAFAVTEGRGTELIASAIADRSPRTEPALIMRPARSQDSRLAWLWRNDRATRAASQSGAPIAWPDHSAWWDRTLASADRVLLIAEADGAPAAVVRFDRAEGDAFEVSINLSPSMRGSGLGGRILGEACEDFVRKNGPTRLLATIHRDNAASRRIFERVGFVRAGALSDSQFERYVRLEGAAE